MLVDVDLAILTKNKLTVKQYLFCYLLYKNQQKKIQTYSKIDPITKGFLEDLVKQGWINEDIVNITKLKVTQKFKNLFESEDYFKELLETYPVKVRRPDGVEQYLRVAQKESKIIYNKLIRNNKSKHDAIIGALKKEIAIRVKDNKMSYFKTLPNWLKAEEWLTYENLDIDTENTNSNSSINSYGTNFV